jgi:hypothetical protein
MPRMFGLHEIELRPEVDPAEYERFFAREITKLPTLPGWQVRLLKGERGTRAGKFLLVFEIESLEARNRFFPNPGEESEESRQFFEQHPDAAAAWDKAWAFESGTPDFNDYFVVAE